MTNSTTKRPLTVKESNTLRGHIKIVYESRELIKQGKTISWNDYLKIKL